MGWLTKPGRMAFSVASLKPVLESHQNTYSLYVKAEIVRDGGLGFVWVVSHRIMSIY